MTAVYAVDACRTPVGKIKGALSSVRPDHLSADVIAALLARNRWLDPARIDDVYWGAANQAGEDSRNVARMAVLLAGLPVEVPGSTVNRLCGSSLEALSVASRAIKAGEAELAVAGGVESMTRSPFVMGKPDTAFPRGAEIYDTTIGWRFVNPELKAKYGVDTMPETAENVAEEFHIGRADQDAFAYQTQQRCARAQAEGFFAG